MPLAGGRDSELFVEGVGQRNSQPLRVRRDRLEVVGLSGQEDRKALGDSGQPPENRPGARSDRLRVELRDEPRRQLELDSVLCRLAAELDLLNSADSIEGKYVNKRALRDRFLLRDEFSRSSPTYGRLDRQKGCT